MRVSMSRCASAWAAAWKRRRVARPRLLRVGGRLMGGDR